ncbi:MAG TPA: hypothetical protein VMZ91_08285 [Candidatus Paceibacterota bacterium]|nr:hypothetical protein [Candidatus Paceibacterota bacterium]
MNWDFLKFMVCTSSVVIIIILLSLSVILYIDLISINEITKENCRIMGENGNKVFIEKFNYFGLELLDCYVQIDENKSIPYDRYIGFNKEVKK